MIEIDFYIHFETLQYVFQLFDYFINFIVHVFACDFASHYPDPYKLYTIRRVIVKTLPTVSLLLMFFIKQLVIMYPVNFSLHKSVCTLKNTE